MPGDDKYRTLYRTVNEDEAEYVRILTSARGCRVTKGKMYKLHRNYNNPHIFEHGELYVVDDDQKDNYSVLMLCATILYK